MPSLQLVFQIVAGLGPYFLIAILLAALVGIFPPWGVENPRKWLFLYIIGLALLPFGGNDPSGGGSLYKQITWGLLYVLCTVMIARSRKDSESRDTKFPIELLILYAFLLATIIWSEYKVSSFKRYLLLVGLLLIATISSRISLHSRSFASIIDKPLAFFMFCGVAVAAISPRIAFDSDGALQAFTSHKNTWGQFMCLCSIVFFNNVLARNNRTLNIPLLAASLIVLYLSKSATSMLAFSFSSCCLLLIHGLSSKNMAGKLAVLIVVLTSSVATLVYSIAHGNLPFDALTEMVFKVTDKSTTLTGRTFLWQLMAAEIKYHPWLGTGFGGFWVGLEGAAGVLVRRLDWGPPTQAHSGYIDVVNEVGFAGLAMLCIVLLSHFYRIFALYNAENRQHFSLHFSIFTSFLIINYAESSFIQGTNIWWIIVTCSIVEVYNRTQEPQSNKTNPIKGKKASKSLEYI
ncbi:O-antigen ligase family protein [Sphaerotilus montanus]|uniref:O-antigen ligase family protein n=1 Tax=Sphaerotilus montanus TaxID=522889 RepID=UPI0015D806C9|nr:O-antigen ligase family protein [Sphaerotilus montanus]NZD55326.1 O-antigen ligase family protein [Sphaerotilus montanus]